MCAAIKVTLVAVTLVGLMAGFQFLGTTASSGQTTLIEDDTVIGIDVDPTGNTATILGVRDSCISVSQGDSFQIDVIVEDVNDLLAWESYVSLDPSLLEVTDRDVDQFLDALLNSEVIDISDDVPSDDEHYRTGAANIGSPPQGGTGSGVLSRLTVRALAPGLASLSLGPIETEVGLVEPTLTAVDGSHIGDSDGDGFFDGPTLDASVAIDQPCPGVAGASIIGLGSLPWWVLVALALGVLASGAVVLARRRASSVSGSS